MSKKKTTTKTTKKETKKTAKEINQEKQAALLEEQKTKEVTGDGNGEQLPDGDDTLKESGEYAPGYETAVANLKDEDGNDVDVPEGKVTDPAQPLIQPGESLVTHAQQKEIMEAATTMWANGKTKSEVYELLYNLHFQSAPYACVEDLFKPTLELKIDKMFDDKLSHEEAEDALMSDGISDADYGAYLDKKYSKKKEGEGVDFLDEGITQAKESEADKEARKKQEAHEVERQRLQEAEEQKAKELEESEKNMSPLEKSHYLRHIVNDLSRETLKPRPRKVREKSKTGGGYVGYTIWECPKCKEPCNQSKGAWVCSAPLCLFGKPKPLTDVPKECTVYRISIPEIKVALTKITMVHVAGGRYRIKPGQEDYISKQITKTLQGKTWKALNKMQIIHLAEADKSKGLTDEDS